jgi:hypothetical protein
VLRRVKASIEAENWHIPSRGFSRQRRAYSLVGAILKVVVWKFLKRLKCFCLEVGSVRRRKECSGVALAARGKRVPAGSGTPPENFKSIFVLIGLAMVRQFLSLHEKEI